MCTKKGVNETKLRLRESNTAPRRPPRKVSAPVLCLDRGLLLPLDHVLAAAGVVEHLRLFLDACRGIHSAPRGACMPCASSANLTQSSITVVKENSTICVLTQGGMSPV